ncbi:MAG: hypothetical protein OSA81_08545 [Longimicrobiales bacterium]|nr:hypothetical protein [Longimicrobiales bacterium]
MSDNTMRETQASDAPARAADSENEALVDAGKTFKITVIGAILFGLASLAIILRTRMGG